MNNLVLNQDSNTVLITRRGDDWVARIYRLGLPPEIRYYSVWSHNEPASLLRVSRAIRKEFGITGTYKPR